MHLGFFKDFGWADSVFLTGSPSEIASLAERLGTFAFSGEDSMPIHNIAIVASKYPAQLYALSKTPPLPTDTSHFHWLCSPKEIESVQGKLQRLAESGSGHQYFDLLGSSAQLVVSVGEYSDSWWQAQA
jgi:hypothetical protein